MGTDMGDGTNFNSWVDGLSDDQVKGFLRAICKWKVQPARTQQARRNKRAEEYLTLLDGGHVKLDEVKAWLRSLGDDASSAHDLEVYYGKNN
jgi:hypothetical protein